MPLFLFRDVRRRTDWCASADAPRVTIGCSTGATITVPDPLLAALELTIVRKESDYFLRDREGHGRVFLNGSPVAEAPLRTGDRVRAANTCFVFCAENEPSPVTRLKVEALLDSEVFAPERVLAAIDAAEKPADSRWWILAALALCGLATGLLLAVLGAASGL